MEPVAGDSLVCGLDASNPTRESYVKHLSPVFVAGVHVVACVIAEPVVAATLTDASSAAAVQKKVSHWVAEMMVRIIRAKHRDLFARRGIRWGGTTLYAFSRSAGQLN
jgi:hypothetical protein